MSEALPLNILSAAWDGLSKEQHESIQRIASWDFSWLIGEPISRFGGISQEWHENALTELKKFFVIKVLYNPHPLAVMGPMISAAWHALILYTVQYEQFCNAVYGKTIHHIPHGGVGTQNSVWIGMYHTLFGPFPEIWTLREDGSQMLNMSRSLNIERVFGPKEASVDELIKDLDSDDGAY